MRIHHQENNQRAMQSKLFKSCKRIVHKVQLRLQGNKKFLLAQNRAGNWAKPYS